MRENDGEGAVSMMLDISTVDGERLTNPTAIAFTVGAVITREISAALQKVLSGKN